MTDPLTEQVAEGAAGQQTQDRVLPRALRPFRTPGYRRLAVALVLSTFASGVWVVGAGVGGHPDRWRPGPAVSRLDRGCGRRAATRTGGRRGGQPGRRNPSSSASAAIELTGMALVGVFLSVTDLAKSGT